MGPPHAGLKTSRLSLDPSSGPKSPPWLETSHILLPARFSVLVPHDAPCGVLCFAHILFLSVHGLLPPVLSQSLFTCCALWLRHSPLLVFVYLIPTHPLNYHLHKATLLDTLTRLHPSLTPLKSRCSPSEAPRCELLVISEAP